MAFVPGFFPSIAANQNSSTAIDSGGNEETVTAKVGKDVEISGDKKFKFCEMARKSDVGWEAAMVINVALSQISVVYQRTEQPTMIECRVRSILPRPTNMEGRVPSTFGPSNFFNVTGMSLL